MKHIIILAAALFLSTSIKAFELNLEQNIAKYCSELNSVGDGSGDTQATGGGSGDTQATGGGSGDTQATGGGSGDTQSTGGGSGDTQSIGGGSGIYAYMACIADLQK